MHQTAKWARWAAAALVVVICLGAVSAHAEDEPPGDPQARLGFPPGATDSSPTTTGSTPPPSGTTTDNDGATTETSSVQASRPQPRPQERSLSVWTMFLSWLEAQLRIPLR
jgi:hypothetical protein